MENITPGQTPLETQGGSTQPTITVEQALSLLTQAERERDEFKQSLLAANRKIEASDKFAKFEEFQTTVIGKLDTLEKEKANDKKEIEDLKAILSNRQAITPNISGQPVNQQPAPQVSDEDKAVRSIFGLPINK